MSDIPREVLAAETAVLRNLLRETTRGYDLLLEESFTKSQPIPVLHPKQIPGMDNETPARPPTLAKKTFDGIVDNLVRETQKEYETTRDELDRVRRELSMILGTLSEAVIHTDARATVQSLNPAAERLTGWRSNFAEGRPLIDIVQLNDSAGQATVIDLAPTLVHGESRNLEDGLSLERRDGIVFAVAGRIAALLGADDEVMGLILTMREIPERQPSSAF